MMNRKELRIDLDFMRHHTVLLGISQMRLNVNDSYTIKLGDYLTLEKKRITDELETYTYTIRVPYFFSNYSTLSKEQSITRCNKEDIDILKLTHLLRNFASIALMDYDCDSEAEEILDQISDQLYVKELEWVYSNQKSKSYN